MTKSEEILKVRAEKIKAMMPGKLEDGQSAMWMTPAFEARDPDGSKDYGIHGVSLEFAKRKGDYIVSVEFYTDWYPVQTQERYMGGSNGVYRTDVIGVQPLCTGFYTHNLKQPSDPKYTYHSLDCNLTGGQCWGEVGSALYGETIRDRLINDGSPGVWAEIEMLLDDLIAEEAAK